MADNFNLRQFLTENKLTKNAKLLKENADVTQAFSQAGITGEVTVAFHSEQGMSEPEFQVMNAQDALAMIASEAEGAEDVLIGQGDEIDQQGDLDPQTQGLECKLEVAILDHGTYEVYQGSNEENLDEGDWRNNPYTPHNFDGVAAEAKKHKHLMKIANELFPQYGGNLENFKPLSPLEREQVYRQYTDDTRVIPFKESKLTAKERRLVEMVENALGLDTDDVEDTTSNDAAYEKAFDTMGEGEEMANETVIPEYKNIEELLKGIEEGTNKVAEEHKMQEMKKIAEALRMKAKKMEESEHAAHISPKDLKQLATDAAKLEKAAEKLKAAFDKKFNKKEKSASAPKAEKVEALQETAMENFDLKKFLTENKLTTNSRMINEADETLMGGIAKNLYLYLSKMKPNNSLDTNGQPLQNVKGEIIKNDPKVKMIYQNASTGLNNLAMQGKAKELEKSHQGNQNNAEITIWYTSNAINALGFVKKEEAEAALKVIVDKYPKEVTGTVNTNKMDYEWAKNYAPEYSIYITMKSDKELARTQSARPQAQ